jgi:hypothetical protein
VFRRARGCAWGWRNSGEDTPGRCWPPPRAACARRRPSWSARSAATRSWRTGRGRQPRSARRGRASPGATRPSPQASAPPSTSSSCSPHAPPPSPSARVTPRTRSRAASSRRTAATAPRASPPGPRRRRARRAAARRRACCFSRAGTCACAKRATPPSTPAPSAPPPRTPRSTSCYHEAYHVFATPKRSDSCQWSHAFVQFTGPAQTDYTRSVTGNDAACNIIFSADMVWIQRAGDHQKTPPVRRTLLLELKCHSSGAALGCLQGGGLLDTFFRRRRLKERDDC